MIPIPLVNNENKRVCTDCGGKCCKSMPGLCAPEDFLPDVKMGVERALLSGGYALDTWEGNPITDDDCAPGEVFFVRPAVKGARELVDRSWGGECKLLTPMGCSLAFEKRPEECRHLVPETDVDIRRVKGCRGGGREKRELVIAWLPYQDILTQMAEDM